MRTHKLKYIVLFLFVAVIIVTTGCSTQKNTAKTRFWHSFKAKYNTYYNGSLAYIDGSLEKENGNKDNFTEIIPLYTVGNKNSRELGKSNFERAIEKSQKAIKLHSIKRRPQWTKNRQKTEKDIEWLSRKEYNPFLWKAWMLMGRSQFHKGAFDEAASTFAYMSRLYQSQPAIYGKARAWLAKAYIEEGWMYDAEDVIRNMQRDSIHWSAAKEWDYTYADYYIHTGEFEKAIPYLRKVIKHEMRRKQKAREWYLMGQLEAALGHKDLAYKAFKRVIRQNPPYELEFNARIAMTEVMAVGKAKQMIGQLRRMAASDKNKDYLDQVYYAIGNIYLSQRDTMKAIYAYEEGNKKAVRSGIEKGVLLLHLGDLYWAKEKFGDARRCYGEAIGLLDKDRKDYEQLSKRSLVLDELVPYTDAVYLQDSLQVLAKLPEKERNEAIDRVIEELKRKEKEEKRAQQEAEVERMQRENNAGIGNMRNETPQSGVRQDGLWYFYNQMAVNQGKQAFQRQWGKRENIDNWQRINKTVVGGGEFNSNAELTDEQRDSIFNAEQIQDSINNVLDSAQNNPHKREYYLAQIPFSEEQIAESNAIIEDGLHHAGVIFKDKLDNLRLSEKNLRRLTDFYPEYKQMDDVFYHLYLLYSRLNKPELADSYIEKLKRNHPESQWTAILSDPYFKENAKFGVQIEDSIYAATYNAFKEDRYGEVAGNTRVSETRFPLGANRDKFLFIGGLSKLNSGDADGCVSDMKRIVEKYPNSRISEMAGMIVNGVNAGKRLRGGKFSLGDVWSRRTAVLNDSDSIAALKFSDERVAKFVLMLAYAPDSLNENQLLFEMARFNFTNFIVRNFEISIDEMDGLHRMIVSGFRNYDEVYQYARQVFNNNAIARHLTKARKYIISEPNLALIGERFSYKDYDEFYSKHFSSLKIMNRYLLTEPAEIQIEREPEQEDVPENEQNTGVDDGLFFAPETEIIQEENDTTVSDMPQRVDTTTVRQDSISSETPAVGNDVVPKEDEKVSESTETDNTIVIPEEEKAEEVPDENTFIIQEEEPAVNQNDDGTIIINTEEESNEQPVTVPQPEKPQEAEEKQQEEKQSEPLEDDNIIFFEDEPTTGSGNENKQENNNQNSKNNYDLEDEYYELEGF